jgi:flagellar assembly protein FliH
MDPIIRSAPVAPIARQLRRLPERPSPARAPEAAPVSAPAAPAAKPAQAPVDTAVAAHAVALKERDAEIAKLREKTQQAQSTLDDAYADAERRGHAAGEAVGELAALERQQVQVDRLKALVFQVGQARQQVMANAEDALVEIAFAAVCRILGEHGASRDTLRRIVRESNTAAREPLTVRLHPDDVALLRLGADGPETDIRLCADASVQLGGCIVDSGAGSLDARFETQLELLAAALRAVRAGRHTGEESV